MNKQAELAAVEALLRGRFPKESSVEDWNRERPDVIVKIDGEVVGIQATTGS
jgi:hypothetical protein